MSPHPAQSINILFGKTDFLLRECNVCSSLPASPTMLVEKHFIAYACVLLYQDALEQLSPHCLRLWHSGALTSPNSASITAQCFTLSIPSPVKYQLHTKRSARSLRPTKLYDSNLEHDFSLFSKILTRETKQWQTEHQGRQRTRDTVLFSVFDHGTNQTPASDST